MKDNIFITPHAHTNFDQFSLSINPFQMLSATIILYTSYMCNKLFNFLQKTFIPLNNLSVKTQKLSEVLTIQEIHLEQHILYICTQNAFHTMQICVTDANI